MSGKPGLLKGVLFYKKKNEWKEYYAVYSEASQTLHLFKTALDFVQKKESRVQLSLAGTKVQVTYNDDSGMAFTLKIESPTQTYVLATVDEFDRAKWTETFEEATFSGQLNRA